jgi:indole-3-glycerol phosphate synthase
MDLEMIIAAKRQALQQRKAKTPIDAVRALASMQRRPQPILSTVGAHVTLIGQVKHTVSRTGSLLETYDPVSMALRYMRGKVDAISLFTDSTTYPRSLDDLTLITRAVSVPAISQDYVLDEYHLVETRAAGASALVLSSEVLDKHALRTLVSATARNRMTSIVQVQTEDQLSYALSLSPHTIGLGSPDECNLDFSTLGHLRSLVPHSVRVVTMCCFESLRDVEMALKIGVDAVIVSSSLFINESTLNQLHTMLHRTSEA